MALIKVRAAVKHAFYRLNSLESGSQGTPYARARIAAKYSFALKVLNGKNAILDVGVGKGFGIKETGSAKTFVGIDYNAGGLKLAQEYLLDLRGRLVNASATAIPFKNIKAITAFEVIEHLSAKEKGVFLAETSRALAKGGTLILSTPLHFGPIGSLNIFHWRKELTKVQLENLLGKYFKHVDFYGMGAQPRTAGKKIALRMQELLASVDPLEIRKLFLPRGFRNKVLGKIRGANEIKPLGEYEKEGIKPFTILAVARKE
ncbi:MAG: class I SAM-dependent methyltransferase [Candidatus Diapherotrites archaeon]